MVALDPLKAIQQLQNRQTMLQDVAQINLCDFGGLFCFFPRNNVELCVWILYLKKAQAIESSSIWSFGAIINKNQNLEKHANMTKKM